MIKFSTAMGKLSFHKHQTVECVPKNKNIFAVPSCTLWVICIKRAGKNMVLINQVHHISNTHSSDYSNFSNTCTNIIINILHRHFPKNVPLAYSFGFLSPSTWGKLAIIHLFSISENVQDTRHHKFKHHITYSPSTNTCQ